MDRLLDIVSERKGVPITTSRKIAQVFQKEHKEQMQSILNRNMVLMLKKFYKVLSYSMADKGSRGFTACRYRSGNVRDGLPGQKNITDAVF